MRKFLLLCTLCAAVLAAHAAEGRKGSAKENYQTYDLKICGVQINELNCAHIADSISGVTGMVVYDPITNTLTLNNATITATGAYGIQNSIPDLTIEVLGANTIIGANNWSGIRMDKSMTITGGGSLTVKTTGEGIGLFLYNDNKLNLTEDIELTVTGGTALYAEGMSGISGYGSSASLAKTYGAVLTVDSARVTAAFHGNTTVLSSTRVGGGLEYLHALNMNGVEIISPENVVVQPKQMSNVVVGSAHTVAQEVVIGPKKNCIDVETEFSVKTENSYTWQGTTYTESGDYTKTLQTANGCDSVVTLHLSICTIQYAEFSESVTESYTWNGVTYTKSGDYVQYLQTVGGCDSIVMLHLTIKAPQPQKWTNGKLHGRFSIAADKQICFSQGNLHYKASKNIWQFAENQTDFVGDANANIAPDYDGWIDLFGWGTGDAPSKTITYDDYSVFTDWGTNAISNGGNEANVWRTLTSDEWNYLVRTRTNATTLFGLGTVNGVNGIILLPDNWKLPEGASFTSSTTQGLVDGGDYFNNPKGDNYSHNTYTSSQWEVMETAGAVFLPAAGYRSYDLEMHDVGELGDYWAATPYSAPISAYFFSFGLYTLTPQAYHHRYRGHSVRLVQDCEEFCLPETLYIARDECDFYVWNGVRYTESGSYTQTFQAADGCDSIVNMTLTIHPSYRDIVYSVTEKEFFKWEGTTYTKSGDYTKTLQTANGCDSIVTLHLTITNSEQPTDSNSWTNGVLPGKFSVGANKQVQFSQGNLQYKPSANQWRFATSLKGWVSKTRFYEGAANANISSDYDGWIDLFGWGTGNNPTLHTTNDADYAQFTDWGVNPIINGGNQPNVWRTLSKAEWKYLLDERSNADKLKKVFVAEGNSYLVLLPDDWKRPDGVPEADVPDIYDIDRIVCYADGDALEYWGAVILWAAGYRTDTTVGGFQTFGGYWSSDSFNSDRGCFAFFRSDGTVEVNSYLRSTGYAVRLVQDVSKEAIGSISIDTPTATKVLHDGQIFILRGEKIYTITGQEVK